MPLVEVVGNSGAVAPAQKAGIWSKVGITGSVIVTTRVVGIPQVAPVGVKA